MREIVYDFEGKKEVGFWNESIPFEDGFVDDVDVLEVVCEVWTMPQTGVLHIRQRSTDLDDAELGAMIDFNICFADVVKDIAHERAVSCTDLVYDQIVVWEESVLVICNKPSGYCFSIVWSEQLGRCMPQLTKVVLSYGIQVILKVEVALVDRPLEVCSIFYASEVVWLGQVEDGCVLGEVAIVGIV